MVPMAETVEIYEVGPRDGLQNEQQPIATADKLALITKLAACGFRRIEATSFVSPKWVPQMADAAEVMAGLPRRPGLTFAVLAPNLKGYEAARSSGADEVAIFVSASEGFSRANLNASIAESFERLAPVAEAVLADGLRLRGYVSVVTDCPFDGKVAPAQVAKVASDLAALGCHEIRWAKHWVAARRRPSGSCSTQCSWRCRLQGLPAIFTIRAGWHSRILKSRSKRGSEFSMPLLAGWVAAPMRPVRPAMWQPKQWPGILRNWVFPPN